MSYEVPLIEGETEAELKGTAGGYPLWEVFVRASRGLNHVHVGSVHASDVDTALQNARDVYTRRNEGVSLWVVPSAAISASEPHDQDAWFDSPKAYRHPTFYEIPEEIGHM